MDFAYDGQKPLFRNVEFGIDMESRSKLKVCALLLKGNHSNKYTSNMYIFIYRYESLTIDTSRFFSVSQFV